MLRSPPLLDGPLAARTGARAIQQKLAGAILATVYSAGWHHLVEPEDWPEELPAVVLDAVRRAPGINDDPSLHALTDTTS